MAVPLDPVPAREPPLLGDARLLGQVWTRWLETLSRTTQQRLTDLEGRMQAVEDTLASITPVVSTWTPAIVGTSGGSAHTYSVRYGQAVKTGRTYAVSLHVRLTAKDASMAGNVSLAGLPAAVVGDGDLAIPVLLGFSNVTLGGQYTGVVGLLRSGASAIEVYQTGSNTAWTRLSAAGITATTELVASVSYWS
jgi:hypothetical protein